MPRSRADVGGKGVHDDVAGLERLDGVVRGELERRRAVAARIPGHRGVGRGDGGLEDRSRVRCEAAEVCGSSSTVGVCGLFSPRR